MSRRLPAALLAVSLTLLVPAGTGAAPAPGEANNFELVGHDPLFSRGMNAAPAILGNHVYVGSRTDGSPHHPHPGVLVVDVADPSNPQVVGEIGPPDEGNVAETSRELRVWPQAGLLLVLNFNCSALIHACTSPSDLTGSVVRNIKFFDVAADPVNPPLVSTYVPSRTPHEFHLWVDPADPARALLWMSTPTISTTLPNLIVTDISGAREGTFAEIASFNANDQYTAQDRQTRDVRLHSMAVTADGSRTYLAHLGGGMLVVDSTEVAAGVPDPELKRLTPPANSPTWPNMTVHSAVPMPGRDLVLTTDEVYGDLLDPLVQPRNDFGCPWGWVHLIDVSDEANPRLVGEFRVLPENDPAFCETPDGQDPTNTFVTSYSAHNPTVFKDLGFVTWHSGGFQAFRVTRGGRVTEEVGSFAPEPLPFVFTEDPALSLGRSKVVMWSFPIIKDGLIYLVDLRNGLYILRYTGPRARQVARIGFLEGNSNVGDAVRLEQRD
ncbi:MAG: LVIVD repeat-containing protein [Actinomycetota bacterium]